MLLMIDNYDSFTYNLVQYFGELGQDVRVFRNDRVTLDEVAEMQPDYLVISPGPCTPNEAGISVAAIERFAGKSRSSASVSATRASARHSAGGSCTRGR